MTCRPIAASRRQIVAGLLLALTPAPLLAGPADRLLRFAAFRNGSHVGEHEIGFSQVGDLITATTSVSLVIRVGPAPVFRYAHHASEAWRENRFERLDTATTSNGKRERVTARAQPEAVLIETLAGTAGGRAPPAPLTHWNPLAFRAQLFHPQTGKPLKVNVRQITGERPPGGSVPTTRWSIRGEAEIDDWYDARGGWSALRGRLPDRSMLEYRRI